MNKHLQHILEILQQENLTADQKKAALQSLKDADKELEITAFKLDKTEKIKHTTAVLLEETITELEQKRKAVEAQNRELEIEASLERVRARAMAMHNSDELAELVSTVFQELTRLDFSLTSCIIWIHNAEYATNELWIASSEANKPAQPFQVKPFHESFFKSIIHAWKASDQKWAYKLSGKEKKVFEKAFFKELPSLPDALRTSLTEPKEITFSASFNNFGALEIVGTEALTDEKFDILHRFGRVFDLSYTRFNDLMKAEAQAREAQIEAALERVRSRSMAMHKSEDLKDVIQVVFEQLLHLNFKIDSASFALNYKETDDFNLWTATPEQTYPVLIHIPYFDHPIFNKLKESKENRVDFFADSYTLEEKNTFFQHFFNHNPAIPKERQEYIFSRAGFARSNVLMDSVTLTITNYQSIEFSEAENAILKRFAKVFEQTYTRFLDLQKAEAQAREGQVEAALERVRSRTMAMQRNDELAEAASLLFKQIGELSTTTYASGFNIWQADEVSATAWMSMADGSMQAPFTINYTGDIFFKRIYEARQSGKDFFVMESGGEELAQTYRYMFGDPEVKKRFDDSLDMGIALPTFQITHCVFFAHGYLMFISYEPCPEMWDVFKRFGKVFEQTYTRFLDLQKAEAQAREARIEATLEKVRSRSLAMHKSDELKEVVGLVFEKLRELDVSMDSACILTFSEGAKGHTAWAANPDLMSVNATYVPFFDHPIMKALYENRDRDPGFISDTWTFEEKNSHWEYLFEHSDYKNLPNELKNTILGFEGWGFTGPITKNSATLLVSYSEKTFSAQENEIIKRFGNVFDQAYVRFLDLQKAEAQAKESQIQLALERVRARTMAMQRSDELPEVTNTIYERLHELKVEMDLANLCTFIEGSKDYHVWANGLSKPVRIAFNDFTRVQRIYNEVLERRVELFTHTFSGEMRDEYYHFLLEQTDFGLNLPDGQKKHLWDSEFNTASLVLTKNTCIQLVRLSDKAFSKEDNEILKRIVKVFEQAYVRFLDLQKAEAQAREAQIEASLERVRSRSMAMHKSEELKEVIQVVFEQLLHLNFKIDSASLALDINETDDFHIWTATAQQTYPILIRIPYFNHPLFDRTKKAIENKVDFVVDSLSFEEKNAFWHHLFNYFSVPKKRQEYLLNSAGYSRSTSFLNSVALSIINYNGISFSDEENAILTRFGKVFEQSYTRFLDLQKAEAQAREAQIEAALERVRSRSMGMQKSEELREVIQVIYEQLIQLNFNIDSAGFAMDYRDSDDWNLWFSDSNGAYPDILHIPYFDHRMANEIIDAKKNGDELLLISLTFEEKNKLWDQFFKYVPMPEEAKKALYSSPGFFMAKALFKNVDLFIQNYTGIPSSDAQNAILIRFGKVFEQTYIRFNDLKQAEAQAREAQIETALERVRSRSLAMHKSDELQEVINTVFDRLRDLEIETSTATIVIYKEGSKEMEQWIQNDERTISSRVLAPFYEQSKLGKDLLDSIVGGKDLLSRPYSKKEKNEWFSYQFEHSDYKRTSDTRKRYVLDAESYCISIATIKNGGVCLGRYSDQIFSDQENEILKRFARVFEQSYTRFLDLQKAEAQAREAQIEAALERVRSRSTGMHKSEELREVIQVIYEQFVQLGLNLFTAGFYMDIQESNDWNLWVADAGAGLIPHRKNYIPYLDHPIFHRYVEAKEKGLDVYAYSVTY